MEAIWSWIGTNSSQIQAVSIMVLVIITVWYAWSNYQLTKLLERQRQEDRKQRQEEKQNRKRLIRNSLLAEIKDISELAIAHEALGNILSADAWQTYKGEIDFLPEEIVKEMRNMYALVLQANNYVLRLQIACGWPPSGWTPEEIAKRSTVEVHISSLYKARDKVYEAIREKASRIIEQLESIRL